MQFLAPLFLAALVAVAVPIVLHLIQREKRQATPFPSLMFLSRVPHRSTRRRRIRDLPLLLLRILALVLLAGAFARPLLRPRTGGELAGGGARELVLLLDRSYSMGLAGQWEAATSAALAAVAGLGSEDRMSIVAFDAGAAVLNQPTGDRAALRALIHELRPGSGTTRYDPAIRLAANLLEASRLPRREVVLVSDYQRAGTGAGLEAKLPAGTELRTVRLTPRVQPNLAVAAVSFEREPFERQERVTPTARILNTGDAPVRDAAVQLELGGRSLPARRVTVAAHAVATVELPRFTLSEAVRGTVSVTPDALSADDAQHFVLAPGQSIAVTAVQSRAGASLFLQRALEVSGDPGFEVRVRQGTLAREDLEGGDVVVLNDASSVGEQTLAELRRFVEQGGGLLVAFGPSSTGDPALADLLPGRAGQLVDRTQGGGATLGYIDLEHPVFELFRAPHSGDLSSPRFYRYRPLQLNSESDSSVRVLARFDDGGVALAERRVGMGRVLAWASTLDREWNDLPVQPLFVPFAHQLLKYTASFERPQTSRKVGEVVDARAAAGVPPDEELVVVAPDGTRGELTSGTRALTLERRGFYTVRRKGGGDAVLASVAANVDVRESELAALDPQVLAAAVRTPGPAAASVAESPITPAERERRQALWWYVLITALVLLAAESTLSNRASRAVARVRGDR